MMQHCLLKIQQTKKMTLMKSQFAISTKRGNMISRARIVDSNIQKCAPLLKHGNKSPIGLSAGTNCTMFYPRMCSSSITKGKCFNLDCTFTHVKGTNLNQSNNQVNNTQQTHDFLKILDNSRTEMMAMITNNLAVRTLQQPIQTTRQIHLHNLLQHFQDIRHCSNDILLLCEYAWFMPTNHPFV
eukprot:TCONS_00022294-protein